MNLTYSNTHSEAQPLSAIHQKVQLCSLPFRSTAGRRSSVPAAATSWSGPQSRRELSKLGQSGDQLEQLFSQQELEEQQQQQGGAAAAAAAAAGKSAT